MRPIYNEGEGMGVNTGTNHKSDERNEITLSKIHNKIEQLRKEGLFWGCLGLTIAFGGIGYNFIRDQIIAAGVFFFVAAVFYLAMAIYKAVK
jgi:hypothetical protein